MSDPSYSAAVFASGGGSNLQALLDHATREADASAARLWRVGLVVSNRECGALDRARARDVPARIIRTKDRPSDEVAAETLATLAEHDIDLVLLAGYLRLLPEQVVSAFSGRMLNIHPALLPDFGGPGMYGMNVHRAVVEAGVDRTGATVHFVDREYDTGAPLAQAGVPVREGDTPEDVAARVLALEHVLYPRAVDHLCAALAAGRRPEPMRSADLSPTDATGPRATTPSNEASSPAPERNRE